MLKSCGMKFHVAPQPWQKFKTYQKLCHFFWTTRHINVCENIFRVMNDVTTVDNFWQCKESKFLGKHTCSMWKQSLLKY